MDYSGAGLNQGSKLVLAAVGKPRRELGTTLPAELRWPEGFGEPALCMPGVIALRGPRWSPPSGGESECEQALARLCRELPVHGALDAFPWIVVCDDSEFCARTVDNFVWVTFTRSDPARDVHGAGAFVRNKHWGCAGPLVIDARQKPHHAPALEPDPAVSARVDALFRRGGPLHGID